MLIILLLVLPEPTGVVVRLRMENGCTRALGSVTCPRNVRWCYS